MATNTETRKNNRKSYSFEDSLKGALYNNLEVQSGIINFKNTRKIKHRSYNNRVGVNLTQITGTNSYDLQLGNVYGNGTYDPEGIVRFDRLNIKVTPKQSQKYDMDRGDYLDKTVTFNVPHLFDTIFAYYRKHTDHDLKSDPTNRLYPLLTAKQVIDNLNSKDSEASLPAMHYQPQIHTNCDQFTFTNDNDRHAEIAPLADNHFDISVTCKNKTSYIINAISVILDLSARLFYTVKVDDCPSDETPAVEHFKI